MHGLLGLTVFELFKGVSGSFAWLQDLFVSFRYPEQLWRESCATPFQGRLLVAWKFRRFRFEVFDDLKQATRGLGDLGVICFGPRDPSYTESDGES